MDGLDMKNKHVVTQILHSITKVLDSSVQKLSIDDSQKDVLTKTLIDSISKRLKAKVTIDGSVWEEHDSSEESIDQLWSSLLQQCLLSEEMEEKIVADRLSRHQRVANVLHDLFELKRADLEKYERIESQNQTPLSESFTNEPDLDMDEFVNCQRILNDQHQKLANAKQMLKVLRERAEALS